MTDGDQNHHFDAAAYDDRQDFVAEYGRELLALLDPRPGERVLDLGCGTGTVTADIADAVAPGGDVVGVDASPAMVERARERHPDLSFVQADATGYEPEDPFDAVYSNAMIHWVDDQAALAAAVHDALRPDGRFVAEFGARGNVDEILAAVRAVADEHGVAVESPWYFPTLGEYATLLEDAGFAVRLARTFDRETTLDGADGLAAWVDQFGDNLLAPFEDAGFDHETVVAAVEDRLRVDCYDPTAQAWTVGYRRLQVVAERPG